MLRGLGGVLRGFGGFWGRLTAFGASICSGVDHRDVATRMVMLISEVEELSQQLNDQFEEEVRSINAEALRELDELRQVSHVHLVVSKHRSRVSSTPCCVS